MNYMSYLYILEVNPLSVPLDTDTFSPAIGGLFVLFMVSFAARKFISLIQCHLFIFAFISFALGDWSKKVLTVINVRECFGYILL